MSLSPSNRSQLLRQISATLFFLTFVLTLTTTITTSLTNDPFTHDSLSTYPLITSSLATVYTFTLTILTLLSLRRRDSKTRTTNKGTTNKKTWLLSPTLPLSTTLLSTLFSGLLIGTTYLSRSDALLPCTAGTTGYHNPYVTYCQLRQTVFWSAVLGAVGFAALAVVSGVLVVRGRTSSSSMLRSSISMPRSSALAKDGDEGDAASVAPPSYAEKDGDVPGEREWEERVRGAV